MQEDKDDEMLALEKEESTDRGSINSKEAPEGDDRSVPPAANYDFFLNVRKQTSTKGKDEEDAESD